MGTELESFLKELAAELCITPEAAERIWKDYHPKKGMTKDEVHEHPVSQQPELRIHKRHVELRSELGSQATTPNVAKVTAR
jgi:hypothetical protein